MTKQNKFGIFCGILFIALAFPISGLLAQDGSKSTDTTAAPVIQAVTVGLTAQNFGCHLRSWLKKMML